MNKTFIKNTQFEILTQDGFRDFDGIMLTPSRETLCLELSDGTTFEATPEHRIICSGAEVTMDSLNVGDIIGDIIVNNITEGHADVVYDPINVSNGHIYKSGSIYSHNCEFIGASDTLISGSKLKSIPVTKPLYTNTTTSVYTKPVPGRRYCMPVDTSRGTGGDYSAFLVIDVTELPYKVVFKYRNNTISSMLYPGVIHKIACEYNNAHILVETNDIGEGVANALYYDLEYENTIFSKLGEIVTWGGRNSSPGLRTTTKTKRIGCDNLKQLIEVDKLIINDYEILYELSNFVASGKSYEADVGNDDLCMCLVIFGYLTTSPKFEEISDTSVRARIIEERAAQEEADAMPVGYYSNGESDEEAPFNF